MQVLSNFVRLVGADDVGVVEACQQIDLVAEGREDPPLRRLGGSVGHRKSLHGEPDCSPRVSAK